MKDTKERILDAALALFAAEGYEAVSVSRIAGEIGMVKSALYKHYDSKQGIFDAILRRMEREDGGQAAAYGLPEGTVEEMPEAYRRVTLPQVIGFTAAMFRYWTEEEFPSLFRRLLTVEQFRGGKTAQLYRQYIGAGPLGYVMELFFGMGLAPGEAEEMALSLYTPLPFFCTLYDGAEAGAKERVTAMMDRHLARFTQRFEEKYGKTDGKEVQNELYTE